MVPKFELGYNSMKGRSGGLHPSWVILPVPVLRVSVQSAVGVRRTRVGAVPIPIVAWSVRKSVVRRYFRVYRTGPVIFEPWMVYPLVRFPDRVSGRFPVRLVPTIVVPVLAVLIRPSFPRIGLRGKGMSYGNYWRPLLYREQAEHPIFVPGRGSVRTGGLIVRLAAVVLWVWNPADRNVPLVINNHYL